MSDLSQPAPLPAAGPAGVIHDIGYRGYSGNRLGRGYATRSLFVHSLRGAWGIGRGAKAKIVPFLMLALMLAPALIWAIIQNQIGERAVEYALFPLTLQLPIVIFLATQAVELLSRDLRNSVLPLYFARPMRRDDYVWAKLAAIAAALAVLMAAPVLLFYAIVAFGADSGSEVWSETTAAGGGLVQAGIHAVVLGALGLAVAAFATRRVFAIGAVVAVFLVSAAVSGITEGITSGDAQEKAGVLTPFRLLEGFFVTVRGGDETEISHVGTSGWLYVAVTLGLLATTVGLLIARYRRVGR